MTSADGDMTHQRTVVAVIHADDTVETLALDSPRLGHPVRLPFEKAGVLKAATYQPFCLKTDRRDYWVYVQIG